MIIVVMGVSGSGKTTVGKLLAMTLGWAFHDADDFHPPANIAKMSQGVPLDDSDRSPWLESMSQAIRGWLSESKNVVLACSALKDAYRDKLVVDPRNVKLIFLKGTYEQIMERMSDRKDHFMPPDLLESQFEILEEPYEAIVVNIDRSPAEIVQTVVEALRDGAEEA